MSDFFRQEPILNPGKGQLQKPPSGLPSSVQRNRISVARDSGRVSQSALTRFLPLFLLAGDAAFILTHIALRLTGALDTYPMFALYLDGGYPEYYQYAKEAWICIAFCIAAVTTREYRYLAWSALFCFLLLDDSLGIHEVIGTALATGWSLSAHLGVRGQDFGEIAAMALTGGVLLMALGVCYWRGSAEFKKASSHLFGILAIIIFFGVFVDSLHFLYEINWKVSLVAVVIEDGGEMIGMSLAAWYAMRLVLCKGEIEKPLSAVFLRDREQVHITKGTVSRRHK